MSSPSAVNASPVPHSLDGGRPQVPKLKTLPLNNAVRSPLSPLSPLSPTRKAMESFGIGASELAGLEPNQEGEVEIDGIPDEHWDIKYSDLVIEKELAEGTFGRVYMGSYFGTRVAVKLLFQVDVVANIGKYILRELAMLRAVTHPNVVQFLGLCRHRHDVFVVTEYVPRGDLMEVLHSADVPPISWSLCVHLMTEITKPLAFLHSRNIIHRDVKLENVLVGQNWSIKLCDFGFARCMDNVDVRPLGGGGGSGGGGGGGEDGRHRMRKMTVAGTDQWMAPEVLLQQPYNEQADVFSLGCTFYELLCRKQPPTRFIANKYAFDVQEFLFEVPKNVPKELVVLLLDMCQLVPHKRPTAKHVLDKLVEVQASLPPVDLTEGSEIHRRLQQQEALAAAAAASATSVKGSGSGGGAVGRAHPQQQQRQRRRRAAAAGEESQSSSESESPRDEEAAAAAAAEAEESLLAMHLRRALSADSATGFKAESPPKELAWSQNDMRTQDTVSPHMRYHSVTVKSCAGDAVVSSWLAVTSSVQPRPRKYFCALLTDGMMHLWKSERTTEFSALRILLEQGSAVQRAERPELLRVSSPVHPGVLWLFECKTPALADRWFNALLGVIMRSDVNYLNRLKSGMHFGWSVATRGERGACFLVQLVKPDAQTAALFVSPQVLRIVRPFTEEILAEWSFAQLSSYVLSPGGQIALAVVRTRLGEPSSAYSGGAGNAGTGSVFEYVFSSVSYKQIYEVLEEAWRVHKEQHDRLFSELMAEASGPASPTSGSGTPKVKNKRMSMGFSKPAAQDTVGPDAPRSPSIDRQRSSTLSNLFQRKRDEKK